MIEGNNLTKIVMALLKEKDRANRDWVERGRERYRKRAGEGEKHWGREGKQGREGGRMGREREREREQRREEGLRGREEEG